MIVPVAAELLLVVVKVNVVSLVLVMAKRPLNSVSFAPAMVTSAPVTKPCAAPVVTVAVPLLNVIASPTTETLSPSEWDVADVELCPLVQPVRLSPETPVYLISSLPIVITPETG